MPMTKNEAKAPDRISTPGAWAGWAAVLMFLPWAAAGIESGVYRTLPDSTVEERGDRVPNESRVVPFAATLTFDLTADAPSVVAEIANAVIEGGDPFPLTVRSLSGARLPDGSYRFGGDYLRATHPSGTQYLFDWRFSTGADGRLLWNGTIGWAGGHFWMVTLSGLVLEPVPAAPRLDIARVGSHVTLSWSVTHAGYALETSTSLPEAGWNPVTEPIGIVGDRFTVTVEAGDRQRFFRLRHD